MHEAQSVDFLVRKRLARSPELTAKSSPLFFGKIAFSYGAMELFACAKVEQQANERGREPGQRFNCPPTQEIKHHPKGDGSENNRGQRVSPHPIRPGDFRAFCAQHHHASTVNSEQSNRLNWVYCTTLSKLRV